MLRCFNSTARYVDQGGGKRPGAFAMYLEPWHADVFDFLDLRKNTGSEENRCRYEFVVCALPFACLQICKSSVHYLVTSVHVCCFVICGLTRFLSVNDRVRIRDLFLALWIPDLFMKRVEENGTWSLFCPCECPGLSDCWLVPIRFLLHLDTLHLESPLLLHRNSIYQG